MAPETNQRLLIWAFQKVNSGNSGLENPFTLIPLQTEFSTDRPRWSERLVIIFFTAIFSFSKTMVLLTEDSSPTWQASSWINNLPRQVLRSPGWVVSFGYSDFHNRPLLCSSHLKEKCELLEVFIDFLCIWELVCGYISLIWWRLLWTDVTFIVSLFRISLVKGWGMGRVKHHARLNREVPLSELRASSLETTWKEPSMSSPWSLAASLSA